MSVIVEKKKVGIFFNLKTYGGVQTCIISLIKGLNKINIIPDLLTDDEVNQKIIVEHDIKLNTIPIKYSISLENKKKLLPFFQGGIDLIYYFKTSKLKAKYDFLYIYLPNIIVNTNINYLYYLSMSPRSPGFSGRLFLPRLKFFLYDYFIKYFIPVYEFEAIADKCVINSGFTADLFFKNYGKKLEVVYPSNLISGNLQIDYSQKSTVLFLSRICSEKRPEFFLELCLKFPSQEFVMAGSIEDDKYLLYIKKLIAEKEIKNLKLFVNATHLEISKILKSAKYYIFNAKEEHFGITTVEAMLFGVIPFVHDSGGQKEIVIWDELRFQDDEIFDKFENILKFNEQRLLKLRQQIQVQALEFSEEVYITKMLKYLNF